MTQGHSDKLGIQTFKMGIFLILSIFWQGEIFFFLILQILQPTFCVIKNIKNIREVITFCCINDIYKRFGQEYKLLTNCGSL